MASDERAAGGEAMLGLADFVMYPYRVNGMRCTLARCTICRAIRANWWRSVVKLCKAELARRESLK